jgi:hypothetical protein
MLNQCSLNGDLFLDPKWMSEENPATVRKHFEWSIDEAVDLLDRTRDENGFERASFSSCIYWLLVGPRLDGTHFVELAEAAALRAAAAGRDHAAKWALILRVGWAGDQGQEVFDRLLQAEPALGDSEMARRIPQGLRLHRVVMAPNERAPRERGRALRGTRPHAAGGLRVSLSAAGTKARRADMRPTAHPGGLARVLPLE